MAIVFNCPHCEHPYKLKDELAGKRATCKNAECRQVITVPHPVGLRIADLGGIVPDNAELSTGSAPHADVEAAALAALNETVKEKEETAAATEIPMTCPHCDHRWTEPFSKAGKNTLCPNEECRQRIKVPEPKKGQVKEDWRSTASGKPSLAKENFEKPTDVMDAEARVVSREAYVKGGGAEQDYEPVSLKHRLKVYSLIALPILIVAAGIWAITGYFRERGEELSMKPAVEEFAAAREELDPVQAGLGAAILDLSDGVHFLAATKMDKDAALGEAHKRFSKAKAELQQAAAKDPQNKAAADRAAVTGELALALLGLGGTDEQVKDNQRFNWIPNAPGSRALRPSEKSHSVHQELQTALAPLMTADFDTKAILARRLARELTKKGQAVLAVSLSSFFFSDAELPEAKAQIALEIYRTDRGSDVPRGVAEELKALLAGGVVGRIPTPSSAQALWQVVGTENAPTLYPRPAAAVSEPSRYAYVGIYLLKEDSPAKALELCRQQGGTLGGQLRALGLYAEWAADPGPAFDSAISAINLSAKSKKDAPPVAVVLRLSQLAAATGRPEQAKQLADLIPDDGAKAWAKGSAIQFAATPDNKTKVEDAAVEVPDDPKKLRAGHFWGRLWIARHNARLMSASDAMKSINLWPKGTLKPFGLAGVALAQHDKNP